MHGPLTPLTLIFDSVTLPIMRKCMYRKSSRKIARVNTALNDFQVNLTCSNCQYGHCNLLSKSSRKISRVNMGLNDLQINLTCSKCQNGHYNLLRKSSRKIAHVNTALNDLQTNPTCSNCQNGHVISYSKLAKADYLLKLDLLKRIK